MCSCSTVSAAIPRLRPAITETQWRGLCLSWCTSNLFLKLEEQVACKYVGKACQGLRVPGLQEHRLGTRSLRVYNRASETPNTQPKWPNPGRWVIFALLEITYLTASRFTARLRTFALHFSLA